MIKNSRRSMPKPPSTSSSSTPNLPSFSRPHFKGGQHHHRRRNLDDGRDPASSASSHPVTARTPGSTSTAGRPHPTTINTSAGLLASNPAGNPAGNPASPSPSTALPSPHPNSADGIDPRSFAGSSASSNDSLIQGERTWLYNKQDLTPNLPSIRDGMAEDEFRTQIQAGCDLINRVGMRLGLIRFSLRGRRAYVSDTEITCIYFHRFYVRESLMEYRGPDIAASCLYLASKVDESFRNLSAFIQAFHNCTSSSSVNLAIEEPLDETSKEFWKWKDNILHNEYVVAEALCFDIHIELAIIKVLKMLREMNASKELSKAAYEFARMSSNYGLCLYYSPIELAAAAIYYAGEQLPAVSLNHTKFWETTLKIDLARIEEIVVESKQVC
ncbi:cyclin-like protein [Polychytrium aggregatum]|uniref:cyclin-like protein n=1 Tax=Polychytrium aggregatum TaxID=110093 RepID=UPI0022FE7EA6|nr:cyclin-like protein [Polychytrium aggregatum]KAI9202051.1 cyclin-like protein [Polychytrium aggregatum]